MRKLSVMIGLVVATLSYLAASGFAQTPRVIDIPTRPGVTQRILLLNPGNPKATVVLFTGGNGWLNLSSDGTINAGLNNFLVRSRDLFAASGLLVALVDAPSDRQNSPYLAGFRQTPEHVADIKAVIARLKQEAGIPVWLVGTSRGTQSVAFIATQLAVPEGGPDGIVLTSTILTDTESRPVPEMPLEKIKVPALAVHHVSDDCPLCPYGSLPALTDKLTNARCKEKYPFYGGNNTGDPCEARAYHGFNGIEQDVVTRIASWIASPSPCMSAPPPKPPFNFSTQ